MDYLKAIFGDQALTFDQFQETLNNTEGVKLANLADGGYVGKEKFDAKVEELKAAQEQLTERDTQLEELKKIDADALQKEIERLQAENVSAAETYAAELAARDYRTAAQELLSGYEFSSELSKKAALTELIEKKFELSEDGELVGAKEHIAALQESDPASFVTGEKVPRVISKGNPPVRKDPSEMSYAELCKYMEQNPGAALK